MQNILKSSKAESSVPPISHVKDGFKRNKDINESLSEDEFGTYPIWDKRRTLLTGQDIWQNENLYIDVAHLSNYSPSVQEVVIIDDLLYVFMGVSGDYIKVQFTEKRKDNQEIRFDLPKGIEPSLEALVKRIIPFCENIFIVQRFVENRNGMENGMIFHAICSSILQILDDWYLMVTQLENHLRVGRLTFQALYFFIQSPMAVIDILAGIATKTSSDQFSGLRLLNLLYQNLLEYSGDKNVQNLLQKLLSASCAPYFEILQKWLCEGILDDPYNEFMIQENANIDISMKTKELQSAYWQHKYEVRCEGVMRNGKNLVAIQCIPTFLEAYTDIILMCGKYLSAIRECGRHVERPLRKDEFLIYDSTNSFVSLIKKANNMASQQFLDLFMKDLKLIDKLKCLKHFFLLAKGDMIEHLMDIASEEFEKLPNQVLANRIQSLLELAIKISSIPSEYNSEPLVVEFDPRGLVDFALMARTSTAGKHIRSSVRSSIITSRHSFRPQIEDDKRALNRNDVLTGWEIFMITYKIDWPLMLIVPPKQLQIYQLLFKLLFMLKRVERDLDKAWQALQSLKCFSDREMGISIRQAFVLCHKMRHTFQQYFRFATFEVLEPQWISMERSLLKAKNVDEVIRIHSNFTEKVAQQCLLHKPKVVQQLDRIVTEALEFSSFIKNTIYVEGFCENDGSYSGFIQTMKERQLFYCSIVKKSIKDNNFDRKIAQCNNRYNQKLIEFVESLGSYYDLGTGEGTPEFKVYVKAESREDIDRLYNLIEILKP